MLCYLHFHANLLKVYINIIAVFHVKLPLKLAKLNRN
jgi:hypothetical protein